MIRIGEDRLVKRVWEVRLLEKIARERSRSTWNERIKKRLTAREMTWMQARRMALYSKKWREMINSK